MKRYFILLALLLSVLSAEAYDFEAKGLLFRITDRQKRTVEVTHWDELTGVNGVPDHYRPDPCLAHHHDSTHVHDEHCGHQDEKEHVPVIPDFPDTLVIPAKVRYKGRTYKVTAVGDGSFFGRENVRLVRLPRTITRIGRSAFSGCNNLCAIEWPVALETIDEYAFYMDGSLDTIILPDSLKHLEVYAFALCGGLKEVQMPEKLETFQGNAFLRCDRLRQIVLRQPTPPIVMNTGIKMSFKTITFMIEPEVMPLYLNDKFWSKQHLIVRKYPQIN